MAKSWLHEGYIDKAREPVIEESPEEKEVRAELMRSFREASGQPQVDAGGYSQVDLRPSWYKRFLSKNDYDIKGPPTTSTLTDVGTSVLGAAQQGAQASADKFAQLPGARAQDIMRMQNKANTAGVLGSLLGAVGGKQSRDYDTQQARAVKDSSALRKNMKTGLSYNEKLGTANYLKNSQRNDELARKQAEENARKLTEADPNSPESRDTQKAAVTSGTVTPEQAAGMSQEQLERYRTALMQTENQRHGVERFDYEESVKQGNKLSEEERDQLRKVEGERRAEEARRQQAFVPGRRWANDNPPPDAVVAEARKLAAAQDDMIQSSAEMKRIQEQYEALRGKLAPLGQSVDAYLGPEENKRLLSRARLLHQKMQEAGRAIGLYGVPQQYEIELMNSVNPMAGSFSAFFRGPGPWDAQAEYYKTHGDEKLKTQFGLYGENDPDRPNDNRLARPAEESVTRFARPEVRRPTVAPNQSSGPAMQPSAELGQPVSGQAQNPDPQPGQHMIDVTSGPVPPIPADARKPPAAPNKDRNVQGMFVITVNGQSSKPRKLTEEQMLKVIQKYGRDAVKQVQ